MAAQKPLQLVGGIATEVAALEASAGAGSEGSLVALNNLGQIDPTMLPNTPSATFTVSEAIAAGALVNLFNSSGIKVRNADNTAASAAKRAHGYAPTAIASGTGVIVFTNGDIVTGLSGMTVGATQYLGAAGARTESVTTTSGQLVQEVGFAISATEMRVQIGTPYIRG